MKMQVYHFFHSVAVGVAGLRFKSIFLMTVVCYISGHLGQITVPSHHQVVHRPLGGTPFRDIAISKYISSSLYSVMYN